MEAEKGAFVAFRQKKGIRLWRTICLSAADWNGDGRVDLIVGETAGRLVG